MDRETIVKSEWFKEQIRAAFDNGIGIGMGVEGEVARSDYSITVDEYCDEWFNFFFDETYNGSSGGRNDKRRK